MTPSFEAKICEPARFAERARGLARPLLELLEDRGPVMPVAGGLDLLQQVRPRLGEGGCAVAFDPETGYAFASNGEGKLTIVHKNASGKYEVAQNLASAPGSKTMALDTSTHTIYLPAAKFNGDPSAHPRPPVVPGSIEILVVGK